MVKVDSAFIYQALDIHNEWRVGLGTDSVWVAHRAAYTYVPTLRCKATVQGPLDYYFGYAIQPRFNADITEFGAGIPTKAATLSLSQNAPNPFGAQTTIKFSIPSKMHVNLAVYSVSGRLVKALVDGDAPAGDNQASWDGRDGFGANVSPGVYFIRMAVPNTTVEKKMVFVK
jgi:hypothetical protein